MEPQYLIVFVTILILHPNQSSPTLYRIECLAQNITHIKNQKHLQENSSRQKESQQKEKYIEKEVESSSKTSPIYRKEFQRVSRNGEQGNRLESLNQIQN